MTLDPQTIVRMNSLTDADIDTIVTIQGTLSVDSEVRLVEIGRDYRGDRLPASILLEGVDEDDDGAYVVVTGTLTSASDPATLGSLTLEADTHTLYPTSLNAHANDTSKQRAFETIDDILSEFSDPIPAQYIIETAVERGVAREATEDVLSRMESAGNVYSPETGLIGGM